MRRRQSTAAVRCLAAAAAALAFATHALAEDEAPDADGGLFDRSQLTGDWGGARSALEARGLLFEGYYAYEFMGVVRGGLRRAAESLGNFDLMLTTELEPLVGWRGARVFLYGLGNHGNDPSSSVGDRQAVSSIGTVATWKLFEAWFEQDLLEGRASVLLGLYDVNSEFDVIPAAALFAHSSPGMGAAFGNSGVNGPSTFPTTSLVARVNVEPADRFYARFVVGDGVPGDPDNARGTEVQFDSGDGVLMAGEVGFYNLPSPELRGRTRRLAEELPPEEQEYGRFGKYAIGAWGYTGDFPDFANATRIRSGSWGVYGFVNQRLSFERADPFQGLTVYLRLGIADPDTSLFDGYVGTGAVYRGPIPGRDDDRVGVSVAAAHLGGGFRKSLAVGAAEWETAVELTYRALLTPWLSFQPGLQWVIDPGGAPGVDNAVIVGGRLILSL